MVAQFGRNVPFSNFFTARRLRARRLGIKARWSNLTLTQLDSGQYNDFTIRLQLVLVRSRPHDVRLDSSNHPLRNHSVRRATADIIGMRFDFNFKGMQHENSKTLLAMLLFTLATAGGTSSTAAVAGEICCALLRLPRLVPESLPTRL